MIFLFFSHKYISSIVFIPSLRKSFFGRGGTELSAYFIGGVAQMRAICVQGGRGGGQKRPKNCVHTISMAPMIAKS